MREWPIGTYVRVYDRIWVQHATYCGLIRTLKLIGPIIFEEKIYITNVLVMVTVVKWPSCIYVVSTSTAAVVLRTGQ